MANHKSAEKRIRSSKTQAQYNKHWRTSVKTIEKNLLKLISDKKKPESEKLLRNFFTMLDRAKKNNVLHRNKVARKKSLFSTYVNKI